MHGVYTFSYGSYDSVVNRIPIHAQEEKPSTSHIVRCCIQFFFFCRCCCCCSDIALCIHRHQSRVVFCWICSSSSEYLVVVVVAVYGTHTTLSTHTTTYTTLSYIQFFVAYKVKLKSVV